MHECVCVCAVFHTVIQDFEFWERALQSSVLTWRVCVAHNIYGGLGTCSSKKNLLIAALRLILRHSGGTSSQFKRGRLHSQTQFYLGGDENCHWISQKSLDSDLEEIVDVWSRKGRWIAV